MVGCLGCRTSRRHPDRDAAPAVRAEWPGGVASAVARPVGGHVVAGVRMRGGGRRRRGRRGHRRRGRAHARGAAPGQGGAGVDRGRAGHGLHAMPAALHRDPAAPPLQGVRPPRVLQMRLGTGASALHGQRRGQSLRRLSQNPHQRLVLIVSGKTK